MRAIIKSHRKNDTPTTTPATTAGANTTTGAGSTAAGTITTAAAPGTSCNRTTIRDFDSDRFPGGIKNTTVNYQPPSSSHARHTPLSSPNGLQFSQHSPSSTSLAGSSNTGSPLKILSPFKNLFSSSKSSPKSNDNLQDVLNIKTSPKKPKNLRFKKHTRSRSYVSGQSPNLKELPNESASHSAERPGIKESFSAPYLRAPKQYSEAPPAATTASNTTTTTSTATATAATTKSPSVMPFQVHHLGGGAPRNSSRNSLGPPITLSQRPSLDSRSGLSDSAVASPSQASPPPLPPTTQCEEGFNNHQPNVSRGHSVVSENHDQDDSLDESDTASSQFSFSQDMIAGRNVSVKYYKIKPEKPFEKEPIERNPYDTQDLGYEADDISDYDFDNNGMDEEDDYEEDDDFGANHDLFEDSPKVKNSASNLAYETTDSGDDGSTQRVFGGEVAIPRQPVIRIPLTDANFSASPHTLAPFNSSYHLSISGPESFSSATSSPKKSNFEDDILESYLTRSQSNSQSDFAAAAMEPPFSDDHGSFELFELSSPMINGLTVGHNLRHRSRRANANPNKLQIHRDLANSEYLPLHSEQSNVRDLMQGRLFPSFHGSFDEKIHSLVLHKVEEFDSFFRAMSNTDTASVNVADEADSFRSLTNSNEADESVSTVIFPAGFKATTHAAVDETQEVDSVALRKDEEPSSAALNIMNLLSNAESKAGGSFQESRDNLVASETKDTTDTQTAEAEADTDIEHRNSNFDETQSANKSRKNRDSIAEMMGLLANLESDRTGTCYDAKRGSQTNKQADGNSEGDMMGLGIQTPSHSKTSPHYNTQASAADSMTYSASSDNESSESTAVNVETSLSTGIYLSRSIQRIPSSDASNPDSQFKHKPSFKRYSWFSSQESLSSKNTPNGQFLKEIDPTDDSFKPVPLDQDLLDEINLLPEDSIVLEKEQHGGKYPSSPGIEHSNSFNRKPRKMVLSTQPKSNKIETLNKTVTFYKRESSLVSAAPVESGALRNFSLRREASTRSTSSCPSVVEDAEEDEMGNTPQTNTSRPSVPVLVKLRK
ncbi:uncharacterized protein LODBEIA_P44430 [Lodderomyces beijingensis]|uniref:Uncharacterized protein n=1 Tax=Lodderomyces beijingensis TaxID=1775926 RepID=A0ABP0ZQM1_9ASCO